MLGFKRIVIAQNERALLIKNRSVTAILEPGVYRIFDPLRRTQVEICNLNQVSFSHPLLDFMLQSQLELCERFFTVVETGSHQVGLLYINDVLRGILAPGQRHVFWKGAQRLFVDVLDIREEPRVPDEVARLIIHTRDSQLLAQVRECVTAAEVEENHAGLLYVDGVFKGLLTAGIYGFWRFNREIKVKVLDTRLKTLEVTGQEILSQDKVSLRVNLSSQYRISDPQKAQAELSDIQNFIYRELQLAMRQVMGTRSLDAILNEKHGLDHLIHINCCDRVANFGIQMQSVGVKDIILPGEMKQILNQVVEAEKAAQANLIRRREETAATRSLLNTARLMSDNPVLLRLKELEALEKISDKVERLTVFGGLDGVLNDTVKIQLPVS